VLEFLLSFDSFLFHLPFEVVSIFVAKVLSEFLLLVFLFFKSCEFILPGLFELMIVFDLLLFFSFASLNLVFQ